MQNVSMHSRSYLPFNPNTHLSIFLFQFSLVCLLHNYPKPADEVLLFHKLLKLHLKTWELGYLIYTARQNLSPGSIFLNSGWTDLLRNKTLPITRVYYYIRFPPPRTSLSQQYGIHELRLALGGQMRHWT